MNKNGPNGRLGRRGQARGAGRHSAGPSRSTGLTTSPVRSQTGRQGLGVFGCVEKRCGRCVARHGWRCRVTEAQRAFNQRQERPEASEVRAREAEEPVQTLWRQWHLPSWEGEAPLQRVWRQQHLPAREDQEPVQRLWRQHYLPAREEKAPLQRVWRRWPLPAREDQEPVQRVWRQWHLPAREDEEPVQRL